MEQKGISVRDVRELLKRLNGDLLITTTASGFLVLRDEGRTVPAGFVDLEERKIFECKEIK